MGISRIQFWSEYGCEGEPEPVYCWSEVHDADKQALVASRQSEDILKRNASSEETMTQTAGSDEVKAHKACTGAAASQSHHQCAFGYAVSEEKLQVPILRFGELKMADRSRRTYPARSQAAPLGAGGVGSIPANSNAQNVPSLRFEMKLSPLHVCSKCKLRPFCSLLCQENDWKTGHKQFCENSGEYGIDFCLRDSPGKGIGVFALRDFSFGEKIIVERPLIMTYNSQHTQIPEESMLEFEKLLPEGGTKLEKMNEAERNIMPRRRKGIRFVFALV